MPSLTPCHLQQRRDLILSLTSCHTQEMGPAPHVCSKVRVTQARCYEQMRSVPITLACGGLGREELSSPKSQQINT